MRTVLFAVVVSVFALPCMAQESPLLQGKVVFRAPVRTDPGWYPAGWSITNIREDATDNTLLFAGVGRKMKNGWMEFMLTRQYFVRSSQWHADFRLQRRLASRLNMQIEIMPFLETAALYNFGRLDYRVGPINLMLETENIHRAGVDSWGTGPGIGLPPRKLLGKLRFAPAAVWYFRPNDPDFVRFYFAFPF